MRMNVAKFEERSGEPLPTLEEEIQLVAREYE